jgi:arginase family enzyme
MIELIVSQGRVADRAPRMIEGAALTAKALCDRYETSVRYVGTPQPHANDDWTVSLPQAHDTLRGIASAVESSIEKQPITFLLSNTCSVSLGSLPVVAKRHPGAVILWIDAHGDFNTPETTDSGYLGGMVLAAACGLWDSGHGSGIDPNKVVLVGARDIDGNERELIGNAGVRIISPSEATPDNLMAALNGASVWIHIDWDVLEPGYLPADYSVPLGLVPEQIKAIIDAIPPERILGIELAEFNASLSEEENKKAVDIILDIVSSVFDNA